MYIMFLMCIFTKCHKILLVNLNVALLYRCLVVHIIFNITIFRNIVYNNSIDIFNVFSIGLIYFYDLIISAYYF